MPYEIVMPRLGWTMEEGTLVEWLKHDGDTIAIGDIIFTVESDKAVNEIEAMEGGILRKGVRVPIDAARPLPSSTVPGAVRTRGARLPKDALRQKVNAFSRTEKSP